MLARWLATPGLALPVVYHSSTAPARTRIPGRIAPVRRGEPRRVDGVNCACYHGAAASRKLIQGGQGPMPVTPTRLRCEYRTDPLGIASPHPRLGWILQSAARAQRQTAYQIR